MRRAHHGGVVADFGGVFGEPQRLDGRLDPGASDQHLIRRSCFARRLQYIASLLIGKQDSLTGRTKHNDARARRARIALNVALELFKIHIAVGIERRRDGRKDTVNQHGEFSVSLFWGGHSEMASRVFRRWTSASDDSLRVQLLQGPYVYLAALQGGNPFR